jgi:hypothetical protein
MRQKDGIVNASWKRTRSKAFSIGVGAGGESVGTGLFTSFFPKTIAGQSRRIKQSVWSVFF